MANLSYVNRNIQLFFKSVSDFSLKIGIPRFTAMILIPAILHCVLQSFVDLPFLVFQFLIVLEAYGLHHYGVVNSQRVLYTSASLILLLITFYAGADTLTNIREIPLWFILYYWGYAIFPLVLNIGAIQLKKFYLHPACYIGILIFGVLSCALSIFSFFAVGSLPGNEYFFFSEKIQDLGNTIAQYGIMEFCIQFHIAAYVILQSNRKILDMEHSIAERIGGLEK